MESKFNYKNFSIVIPIYNEEEILEESTNAIFSICKRMEIDFEIIFSVRAHSLGPAAEAVLVQITYIEVVEVKNARTWISVVDPQSGLGV